MDEVKMASFDEHIKDYRKQLAKGSIQEAYKGLMDYIRDLRGHFKTKYPDYVVPSNIYYGYMDMTYFALVPQSLKRRNLRIAIVFLHELFRFEVWLVGINRNIKLVLARNLSVFIYHAIYSIIRLYISMF